MFLIDFASFSIYSKALEDFCTNRINKHKIFQNSTTLTLKRHIFEVVTVLNINNRFQNKPFLFSCLKTAQIVTAVKDERIFFEIELLVAKLQLQLKKTFRPGPRGKIFGSPHLMYLRLKILFLISGIFRYMSFLQWQRSVFKQEGC